MVLKYFAKSINLLNFMLFGLAAVLALRIVFPLFRTQVKFALRAPSKPVAEEKTESPQLQPPSPNDYTIIGEQNLFHPLRLIPVEKPPTPPLPKPEFVLSGTLLAGDLSVAYMEDKKAPQSTPGRGKRQTAVRRGEAMSGFVLRDVEADRVVMVRGEEAITVLLNDASKMREVATTLPPPAPGQQAAGGQSSTLPGFVSAMQQGAAAIQTPAAGGAQPASPPAAAGGRIRRRTGPVNYNAD